MWLYGDLEQEVVADLGLRHFFSVDSANLHVTRRRWTGVGNRSGSCDHADVEAKRYSSFSGVVDAFDVVSSCPICNKFRMFLND